MGAYGQQSRSANEYYNKGVSALEKKNYDYAIAMLLQVVQEQPLFCEARRELHRAEREKYSEHPPSYFSLMFIKLNNLIPMLLALYYEARKDYEKAIAFYEDLLKSDLNNKLYLKKIHLCSLKNKWIEVSIVALESLFEINSENAEIAKTLGELYRDIQNIEKAASYFKKSLSINPADQKVSKSLKDLEALRTIKTGGWEKDGDYRSKIKDENEAQKLETEAKLTSNSDKIIKKITKLENSLKENPQDLNVCLDLIDAYLNSEKLDEAETLIQKTEQSHKGNEYLENRISILKKTRIANQLKQAESDLHSDPDNNELNSKVKNYKIQLMHAERDTLEKKVKLYPNDLSLKFQLGEVYFYLGDYDKAIAEFQHSVKDPALSTKTLNKLGLSFHNKGMHDLAVLQFSKALTKIPGINDFSKEIIYNLGSTLEAMGKKKEALDEYKKIYEVDISYRDIAQKIENFYKK